MRLDHLLSKEGKSRGWVYCLVIKELDSEKFPVLMRLGVTPVPIPNTMVKPQTADGTILETVWESRWVPESFWGCSSVGRAPALQAGGQGFESLHLH